MLAAFGEVAADIVGESPFVRLFCTSSSEGRLAGRGSEGAVCTNCANGVTSGMLDRRTAAGKAAISGGEGFCLGDGGVDAALLAGLTPKYPLSSGSDDDVTASLA